MNNYIKQATDFLTNANATMKIDFVSCEPNKKWNESVSRNKYFAYITTPKGKEKFVFWDSLHNKAKHIRPTEYDVLACLTKYDVGEYEDFCAEFGYDPKGKGIKTIYQDVKKEYAKLCRIFTAEDMEKLREIN